MLVLGVLVPVLRVVCVLVWVILVVIMRVFCGGVVLIICGLVLVLHLRGESLFFATWVRVRSCRRRWAVFGDCHSSQGGGRRSICYYLGLSTGTRRFGEACWS